MYLFYRIRLKNLQEEFSNLKLKEAFTSENYTNTVAQMEANLNQNLAQLEAKNNRILELSNHKSTLETKLEFLKALEGEKKVLELKLENLNRELIKMQEKLASNEKMEGDLKMLLEHTKQEITIQNRTQYQAIHDQLKTYTAEKGKEMTKEAGEAFEKIIEKDVKEIIIRLQENLSIQQEKLMGFQKPIEFFTKILAGSKEAGTHGEQTIVNQLEQMGLRYGVDYLTQLSGKGGEEERLLADVVILVPNGGKKDVLIIDSKSSTKLGSSTTEFMSSIEASANIFARKDYKNAVERRLKEQLQGVQINQTHVFIYLPFDRMLSRIAEEKPEFLKKIREKDIGILTPIILDFLLDTIKLYSAKIEMNERAETVMADVKILIERTAKVLEYIKDLGRSVEQTGKKYVALKGSVSRMFVPYVNKMAKPLNVKPVLFDDLNEEELKQIEVKEE